MSYARKFDLVMASLILTVWAAIFALMFRP